MPSAAGVGAVAGCDRGRPETVKADPAEYPRTTVSLGAWSLVPPVLAIVAAIVTRRVYQSLLLGILVAAGMVAGQAAYASGGGIGAAMASVTGAFMLGIEWIVTAVSTRGNAAIFVFILFLGGIVGLLQRSGAVAAFGQAALRRASTKRRGQVLAWLTGSTALAIDDHFNVIAAGTMFRPLTDRLRVSREKLAYLIDSTGAPVAILNPVSTWAGFMVAFTATALVAAGSDANAFTTFLRSIPYNFYAWLTLAFVLAVALGLWEYGPMRHAEQRAERDGEVLRPGSRPLMSREITEMAAVDGGKAKASDLGLPLLFLFVATVVMLWATGRAPGLSLRASIAGADAPLALAISTLLTLIFIISRSSLRGTLDPDDATDAVLDGFKAMTPALVILALAFTLGLAVAEVGLGDWVAQAMGTTVPVQALPLLAFVVSAGMAFATGTSFGTFAIMIPITLGLTAGYPEAAAWYAPVLAASAGGGVFGDHCSPISDTTVLSSMAAQCDHIDHVRTQIPYALTTAAIAAVGYGALALGAAVAWAWGAHTVLLAGLFFLARTTRVGDTPTTPRDPERSG